MIKWNSFDFCAAMLPNGEDGVFTLFRLILPYQSLDNLWFVLYKSVHEHTANVWPLGDKNIMLNLTEHEISPAHKW